MSIVLYSLTAAAILVLCHRFLRPMTRAAALVLLLLPLLFTGRALLTGGVYGPIDLPYLASPLQRQAAEHGIGAPRNVLLTDLYAQMIPWRQAVRWSIGEGRWPLWNPFILCGDILAAAAQPAAYSPFTLLALLLPVAQSLTFSAAITFFIAGAGAFLFLREIGCREITSLIAAAGWMYSTAISFFILWPLGASWALLPLVLTAVDQIVDAGGRPARSSTGVSPVDGGADTARRDAAQLRAGRPPAIRPFFVLTTALVLLLLAGHPETAFHVTVVGVAWGLFRRPTLRAIALAIGAGVVALLFCAVYLLPLLEAVPQTSEHAYRTNVWAAQPRGVHPEQSMARIAVDLFPFLHLRRWNLEHARFVNPDSAAVGSLLLAAALFAIWRVRSRDTWFFFALLLFALVARAEPWWFERPLQKLPLFDIALNARFSFAAAFSLVTLAALGLEAADRWLPVTNLVVLVLLGAGTWWIGRSDLIATPQMPWGGSKIAAELIALALAALLIRSPRALPMFFALLLLQRVVEEGRAYPTLPASAAYPPVPIFSAIDRSEPFRIVGTGDAFPPGTSAMYGLEDTRGYQAMTLQRLIETYPLWSKPQPVWFNRVDDLTRPFLSFLNVRYAITAEEETPPGWKEAARQPGARLLENERVLPRAFVPRRVRLGIAEAKALEEMAVETDFSEHAWIVASEEPHQRDNGPGTVAIGEDHFDVTMERPGWLVISQSAWKGWRAYVDGKRVGIQIANHAFLSVYVPQGRHQVRLVYLPQSFVTGRMISAITLLGLFAFAAIRRFRR
jgi:hypothetical protein